MQCSNCGTSLPAGTPFCPNCGNRINPANPTPSITPQQGVSGLNNNAIPAMDFGPLQETSSVSPQAEPAAPPVQPYQPQQMYQQQQQPIQQQHMIFGSGAPQVNPQTQAGVPPQQAQFPQPPPQQAQQPTTVFGPQQGYAQAGPPPQQAGMFLPGQSYSGWVPPTQQPSGTFGREQFFSTTDIPQQQQAGMYPQGQFAQPMAQPPGQRRRSGLSTGIIVLLVVLVIVIIGGSGIVLYATLILPASRNSQTNANPTVRAKTPIAQATTPITTTNPQDLYTQVISQTPTLNDPLTNQDSNNWQDLSTLKSCTFTGGTLHLNGSSASCIGESTNFGDFAYQVEVTIIQGTLGGVVFRVDAINQKLYFFGISPNGLYALIYDGGTNQKLLASATSSAIVTGLNQQNMLTVIARGSSLYLYINKQYVSTLTDSSSTIGAIGMLVGNSTGGTSDVTYSNAQVWTL
jgi:zinc-ribbon domain